MSHVNDAYFVFVWIPIYFLFVLLWVEGSRLYYLIQLLWYWVLPFIFLPMLIYQWDDTNTLYDIISIGTIVFAAMIIHIIRHQLEPSKQDHYWTFLSIQIWSLYFILFLLIFESVIFDLQKTVILHQLFPGNAFLGIFLMLTLSHTKNIKISSDDHSSIQWKIDPFWIFGYCVFDAIFIYNQYCHERLAILPIHLGVPLIIIIWTNCAQWIQHRIYTFCICQWISILPFFKYHMPFWRNESGSCEYVEDPTEIKWMINMLSFGIGVLIFIFNIYDQCKIWKGKQRIYDKSILQWMMSKCCKCCHPKDMEKDRLMDFVSGESDEDIELSSAPY